MQVLSNARAARFVPGRLSIALGLTLGACLIGLGLASAWLVLATPLLGAFMPAGRPSASQLAFGALAWTIGLAAPAAFALLGAARISRAFADLGARRPRSTPAVRAGALLGDEFAVAVDVQLPDTARPIDELVIGPFGAAVVELLPPAGSARQRGRHWEGRGLDGRWRPMDDPRERAARDAESVRRWFTRDDRDHVVKVFAAVVGTDASIERTSECAVLRPDELATWLAALPGQRMLSHDRRVRIVELVRDSV